MSDGEGGQISTGSRLHRRRRAATISVVVVLLAFAIWMRCKDGGMARDERPGTPLPAAERASAGDGPNSRTGAAATTRPIVPMHWSEPDSRAAEPPMVRVLVVDDATELPVPDADVVWCHVALPPDERPAVNTDTVRALLAAFDEMRERARTNGAGVATILRGRDVMIAARKGRLFGLAHHAVLAEREVRLHVRAGPLIAARVLGPGETGVAGVSVVFRVETKKPDGTTVLDARSTRSRAGDGLAVLDHPATGLMDCSGDVRVCARLNQTGDSSWSPQATLADLEDHPLIFHLPATGRLLVLLTDAEGAPWREPATVFVGRPLPGAPGGGGRARLPLSGMKAATSDGRASIDPVVIGSSLVIGATSDGYDPIVEVSGGPISAGEERVVQLAFRRRAATLRGRAIDDESRPVRNAQLRLDVVPLGSEPPASLPTSVSTDGRGEFTIGLEHGAFLDAGCELDLELADPAGAVFGEGAVIVKQVAESGDTLIGDVRVGRPSLLASGTVVDEQGQPVSAALVMPVAFRARYTFVTNEPRGQGFPVRRMRARSAGDGRFEIPLPPRLSRSNGKIVSFGLTAELEGYACRPGPTDLVPGQKDVSIVLEGTGSIEGTIAPHPDLPFTRLSILVARADEHGAPAEPARRFPQCVESDGRFCLRGIAPGVVTLTVVRSGASEPLAQLGNVTVSRRGGPPDERLERIALKP